MTPKLLSLEGLSKFYTGTRSVVVGLNEINVSFDRGELVAITGESGSGKSTLAHVLGGILPYESGEMYLCGRPTSHFDGTDYENYRRDNISFISQNYGILPGTSVMENVVSALRLAGLSDSDADAQAKRILQEVELWELRRRKASKLSSGQKQRLSIARALAKPAPILIADEPTGNLDPENSAKVIELLARAARERLVILITHEFSEAADHATRHIVIQDGRIAMDMPLRPAAAVTAPMPRKAAPRKLSFSIAGLQMRSRPVWTSLVLLFFALTAFAVFAFLGTFIVNLDDTSTRIYDNSAFQNGDPNRIVVARPDGSVLDQADYNALRDLRQVVALERYGYASDILYAWREGVDYTIDYDRKEEGDEWSEIVQIVMRNVVRIHDSAADYVRTVPVLPSDETFLTAGRLPESMWEVVLCGDADQIGSTITVYLTDRKNWAPDDRITLQVTVVGVTDHGSGLYFYDDVGRAFTSKLVGGEYANLLIPNAQLQDHQCRPYVYAYDALVRKGSDYSMNVMNVNLYDPDDLRSCMVDLELPTKAYLLAQKEYQSQCEIYALQMQRWEQDGKVGDPPSAPILPEEPAIQGYHNETYPGMVEVSPASFDRLTLPGSSQLCVFIEDYAYVDRVLDAIQDLGYLAVSPYRQGSTMQNPVKAEERMQTLSVCILALLAVIALQIIVLRALFCAQTESYHTLSSMGLNCSMAKHSVHWQILLLTLFGQILGFGIILLLQHQGIRRIADMMKYLPPVYFVILCAVHLAASVVSGLWIARALGKQVYPMARRQSDMDFEEEEATV